jgi:adhesin transport system outer membrane protein
MTLAALVLGLWTTATSAQGRLWTFSEALKLAIAGHPSVLAQRSSAAAAEADYDAAKWERFPTPSFQTSAGANDAYGTNPTSSRFAVQQPLYAGGRITAGIDATLARKEAADFSTIETQVNLALQVAAAYAEVARQQIREEQGQRSIEEHQRLLDLIERRVQQEISAPVDRELAQSRLYLAMSDQSVNVQQRLSALAQLMQLTGQPMERVASLDAGLPSPPSTEAAALEAALAANPTIQRIEAEARAASAEIESKRSAIWPQLSLRYERDFGGPTGPLAPLTEHRVLLLLQATPGAGLAALSNVQAARYRQNSLEYARAAAVRDLQQQISVDLNELRQASLRLDAAERSRQTAASVFDSFTRQYTTGRKTWIDVMNSVREFTQSAFAVADAKGQRAGALLRLAVRTGTVQPLAR